MAEPEPESSLSQSAEEYLSKRSLLNRDLNYYEILELDLRCSKEDVRHSYYHFARIFHPDKCGSADHSALLEEVKLAYEVLSNEYKRMLYDIVSGHYEGDDAEERLAAIYDVVRQKYFAFIHEKAESYLNAVNREFVQQGLVIKKALYGDLSLLNPNDLSALETVETKHLKGPFIDVTVQLQLLIQNGVLHLNSGTRSSFAHLNGFYNPIHFERGEEGNDSQLYILYLFKNNVHEVTVNDRCCVSLPMKSHLVYGSYIKGPYSLGNLALIT